MPVLKQYCNVLCMSLLWLAQWMHVRHLIRRVYSTTNWNLLVTWPQSRGTGHLPASALGLKGRWHLHYIYITNTMVVFKDGRVHKKSHSTLTALGLLSSSSDHAFHVQTWAMRLLSASYSFNSSIYISCKHCTCVVPLQYCLQNSHSPTPRLWFHTSIEQRLVLLKCAIYEHCRTLYNKQPAA